MTDRILSLGENFIANRDTLKRVFKWDEQQLVAAAANEFTSKGVLAEAEELEQCLKIIKKNTSVFSSMRGNAKMLLATKMCLSGEPEGFFEDINSISKTVTKQLGSSDYTPLVCALFIQMLPAEQVESHAARAKQIYKLMHREHPIATGSEDTVFAALMSMSDRSDESLVSECETILRLVKKRFGDTKAAQTVSQVFVFAEGTPEEKADRLFALYDALDQIGVKFGKHEELASLAALAVVADDLQSAAQYIKEISVYLDGQKGYGSLSVGSKTRHMQAAMLATSLYENNNNVSGLAASVSTLAMVAAQQAAINAAIVASIAASSTASTN